MILILATADDDHAAAVEPLLRLRGASVAWVDLAELPARAELSVAYEPGERSRPLLRVRGAEIDLRSVTAVWSLHPQPPLPHDDVPAGAVRDYVARETLDGWIGASALMDCVWLPGPRWHEQRAGHKPPTLITNSREDFLDFHRRHNGALVSKTVHNRLLPVGATERYDAYVLTEVVANRDVAHAEAIRYCPVTVQPY
ncbi:MAG: hypothetical protein ABW216_17310, partial [Candidatus Rokuibacteriota bacterium]